MTHTKGPWKVFVNDSGGEWTGWPMSINAPSVHEDCVVVRTGGQYPYAWDYRVSQAEAVANAHLIAASPKMLEALEGARWLIESYVADFEHIEEYQDICEAIKKARGEE